jgi:cathepsin L
LLLVAAALVAIAVAAPQAEFTRTRTFEQDSFLWGAWKVQHGKTYRPDEETERFAIFQRNLDFVQKFNSEGHSHTVGMNRFGDLTNEEYRKLYLAAPVNINYTPVEEAVESVPAIDWRTKGYVTAVKDQGQCGSCYSFSTTGAVEGAFFKKTGKLVSSSEQNIVDCSSKYGNDGCNGGLMTNSYQYIIASKGIDTEASYPYTAKQGKKCKFSSSNVGATISSFVNITTGSESALQQAAATIGPIAIAIDASQQSFQLYQSGVYIEPACSSTQLDHGVLIVGMGTDSKNGDYYIVKNSWAASWGNQGYLWMAANRNNQCGVATMASYPIA